MTSSIAQIDAAVTFAQESAFPTVDEMYEDVFV